MGLVRKDKQMLMLAGISKAKIFFKHNYMNDNIKDLGKVNNKYANTILVSKTVQTWGIKKKKHKLCYLQTSGMKCNLVIDNIGWPYPTAHKTLFG